MDIESAVTESIKVKKKLLEDAQTLASLEAISHALVDAYKESKKLLIAGNGGSAADAQHFAAEITCQYMLERKGRPAIALHCDTSAMTAWGNDISFETHFGRKVDALGVEGDALFLISTSGNSKNLIHAAEVAKEKGIKVFGLLGRDGGKLLDHCDEAIVVPSQETPRIQESHIMIIHIICDALDKFFYESDKTE